MAIQTASATKTDRWQKLAQQLRVDSIRATTVAGSGHPTSAMSAADLAAVLLDGYLRYDFSQPKNPNNDHFILSKGHAAPLLYAMYRAVGAISDEELLSLRKLGSRLEGHPTPALPWVDVATGSLGQGLPIGVGIATAGKMLEHVPFRVWVLMGDSEMAEGSIWEAMGRASDEGLGNLIGIVDVNRLGQRGPTALGWDTGAYANRARAFGWRAIEIDGHDLAAIDRAYAEATSESSQPTLIVAKTKKGRGVSFVEDKEDWHGKALSAEQEEQALRELGGRPDVSVDVQPPPNAARGTAVAAGMAAGPTEMPTYEVGSKKATRQAFGEALRALGATRQNVVAIDAEVGNSTFAELFGKAYPERYFQTYIAEQQLISMAVGMSVLGFVPFAATFAAFLSRAYDFIRMAAISQASIRLCGSHAGVSIGEDGPSQMALEDLAMLRAVGGSTVLYPFDATSTAALVEEMADREGVVYMRTTRAATSVIYGPDEKFPIGGSKVVKSSDKDRVTIVAAGITLDEALKAHDELAKEGIPVRVIDAYSVKPIDADTLHQAAREVPGGIVVVEDHWPEGGLGAAVVEAFADGVQTLPRVKLLGVTHIPGSGTPAQLLDTCGISARHIVDAAKALA
jgi:transketolase